MVAFDIGRPAVREALLSLQNKGLTITENGRRAMVCRPGAAGVFAVLDSFAGMIIVKTESFEELGDVRVFIEALVRLSVR